MLPSPYRNDLTKFWRSATLRSVAMCRYGQPWWIYLWWSKCSSNRDHLSSCSLKESHSSTCPPQQSRSLCGKRILTYTNLHASTKPITSVLMFGWDRDPFGNLIWQYVFILTGNRIRIDQSLKINCDLKVTSFWKQMSHFYYIRMFLSRHIEAIL